MLNMVGLVRDADSESEINLGALNRAVWRRWPRVLAWIVGSVSLVILYLHITPYRYSVMMEIAPVASSDTRAAGMFGALSSLTGISLSAAAADNFQLVLDGLTSEAAAQVLVRDEQLIRRIFVTEWDPENNSWKRPVSRTGGWGNYIRRLIGIPVVEWRAPDATRLYLFLQRQVKIIPDPRSSVVTLRMDHPDPKLAADLLVALNAAVDNIIRTRALERADGYIEYLSTLINRTTVSEYRQALLTNLSEQAKMRMMAAADVPFASSRFSGPVSSLGPTSPPAFFMLVFGVIFGFVIGAVRAVYLERRDRSSPVVSVPERPRPIAVRN
jgi:uncharacterized protein involved in exopolysaccharide biosynthesis